MNLKDIIVEETPASRTVRIISDYNDIRDPVKVATRFLRDPAYNNYTIGIQCDCAGANFILNPQDRTPGMTAVDIYKGLWRMRRGYAPLKSDMLVSTIAPDGKILAVFGPNTRTDENIYYAALEASLLSRENGGRSVEFEFRDRKVVVDGKTHPEDIEATFPPEQRTQPDMDRIKKTGRKPNKSM